MGESLVLDWERLDHMKSSVVVRMKKTVEEVMRN